MRDDITNIAIEDYLVELMPPRPQALAELERQAREHGRPLVGPVEGQFLYMLAKDGIPYAIDFTNPAPDMDYWSLKEKFFRWAVAKMADMCIAKALSGPATLDEIHWSRLLNPHDARYEAA